METSKTAILVDGGFYRKAAEGLWGRKAPEERADELYEYALRHITCKKDHRIEPRLRELYRIFYYDCPPVRQASVWHPLKGRNVNFSQHDESFKWADTFQKALSEKRKVACRMGEVVVSNAKYNLKPCGVDMRIGLDIAALSYDGLVDRIVLIAGDIDFAPAAKTARRHGVDFLIDPMGHTIKDTLAAHADGIESFVKAAE